MIGSEAFFGFALRQTPDPPAGLNPSDHRIADYMLKKGCKVGRVKVGLGLGEVGISNLIG